MGSGEDSPHSSIWTILEHIREEWKAFFWFIGVDKGQNIESCRAMFTEEEDARCEGAWREEGGSSHSLIWTRANPQELKLGVNIKCS